MTSESAIKSYSKKKKNHEILNKHAISFWFLNYRITEKRKSGETDTQTRPDLFYNVFLLLIEYFFVCITWW